MFTGPPEAWIKWKASAWTSFPKWCSSQASPEGGHPEGEKALQLQGAQFISGNSPVHDYISLVVKNYFFLKLRLNMSSCGFYPFWPPSVTEKIAYCASYMQMVLHYVHNRALRLVPFPLYRCYESTTGSVLIKWSNIMCHLSFHEDLERTSVAGSNAPFSSFTDK